MIPLLFLFGTAAAGVLILFISGVYFARCAGNPRAMVERMAKRRGIDPLAHVTDESVYFRSVKRWCVFRALVCLAGSALIAVVLYRGFADILQSDLFQSIP